MITFSLKDILPRFLLNDRNGYAMAKAMETALLYFLEKCQEGLNALNDPDKMPEWRLDEMAWEYNLLYDYNADITAKRNWIKNARAYYRRHGTPDGLQQYLAAYFDVAEIVEWFNDNDLEPNYFDVKVTGVRTEENAEWIQNAIQSEKNVRSVLRNVIFNGGESSTGMLIGAAHCGIEAIATAVSLDA